MQETQSAPQSPVREGDILAGKYRVEKVLGVGGMGVVVAAMHTELDQRVALKFLQPAAAQNPGVVARFNREARAAAKIKSQHVARVIDVGSLENGTPYIVMEYLEGKDLSDVLAESGPLPVRVAVDYVLQATEAIAEAHAAGFVHRDLKPPNLFLAHQSDGTSIIKVLDFGISKAVIADEPASHRGALTGTAEIFGSPTYMSPEQLKSSRDVDARADIWALGIILYELITGRAPFDRNTVAETFGSILHEQPKPLRTWVPEVPEELDRVVLRCLEKDRDRRLGNVAELAKALFPFAGSASRAGLDRTTRVLRRAGVAIRSEPPPSMEGDSAIIPRAPATSSAGAQTGTGWGTAGVVPARPRSGARALIVGLVAGVLVSGVAGLLLLRRTKSPLPTPAAVTDPPRPADTAVGDTPRPPAPALPPPPTAQPVVTVAVAATPSAAPSVSPRGKVTTAIGGRTAKAAPTAQPSASAAPTAAPAKPPPKPPDGDDFGDRK